MFSIILNVIGSLLHFYVASRLYKVPFIHERIKPRAWWLGVLLIWLLYLVGNQVGDAALDWRWWPGQFAVHWLGITFVMALCLLPADIATGFGLWWRSRAPRIMTIAAAAGVLLTSFSLYQGLRAPRIVEYEVAMKDLPAALDGTVLVAITDIHLGAQRRSEWMERRVEQINALNPAAVVMVGDMVEDEPLGEAELPAVLRRLNAPMGVWAVTGNHEFYGNLEGTIAEFEAGGVRFLRDAKVELAPGLVLAGIDDIGRAMRRGVDYTNGLNEVLDGGPQGATILLSHIPAAPIIEQSARQGVDLMLSGHTHAGQIWPFSYLVKRQFPPLVGEHAIGDMTLIISRGAGSWGPRMRLWQPGEILKLTLRSAK
jgi:predicted MPP superfamily phosphohydrolase